MKGILKSIIVACVGAAAIFSCGCSGDPAAGYTMKSPYRTGIKTVAVPIWVRGQNVYRRDIEMRLAEALTKRIELVTNYKVVPLSRADTELTGTIDAIDQRVLGFNPDTSQPREIEITMAVSMTWTDLRTGTELVKHKNLRVTGTYIPSSPVNQEFFNGEEDVINKLAARVVEQMQADW